MPTASLILALAGGAILGYTGRMPAEAAPVAPLHPLAQGSLEIRIDGERLVLIAIVSLEEVLVESAASDHGGRPIEERVRLHAPYLVAHFEVRGDGKPLPGRFLGSPSAVPGRFAYEWEYPLQGVRPDRIRIAQDVLRECEFSPGNPWEATFVVRLFRSGREAGAPCLLTTQSPLEIAGPDALEASDAGSAWAFVRHGISHILRGYDHLLFVTALLLAVRSLKDLVLVVSAFTVAHTLTLTLAALDILRLPERVVEPMIAASIVVVALQNLFWPERSRGRLRLATAFLFGLFHGLGFAGGLLDAMSGLPATSALWAIAAFSLGVEIGHQSVVLPGFFLLGRLSGGAAQGNGREVLVSRLGSVAISLAGAVYFVAALR